MTALRLVYQLEDLLSSIQISLKLKLLIFVHDFSMFLSILLKEHLDLILNSVKHHLYGITSTQVSDNVHDFCLFSFMLLNIYHDAILCIIHWSIFSPLNICKMSDVEFGRLQARDMLQHLWTGPISNASVDVVQGSRSVEVRAVGVTKVILFWLAQRSSCQVFMISKILFVFSIWCVHAYAGCSHWSHFRGNSS